MTGAPIPESENEVTPDWLSMVLSYGGQQVSVSRVEHLKIVHGAGTKLRVRVSYVANPDNLPDYMWIKTGWEEHSPLMETAGVYAREATFYRDLASAVGTRAPACYFTEQDRVGRSVVILEDLLERPARLWECTVPVSVEELLSLLETLAELHARWWEDEALMTMTAVERPVDRNRPTAEWPRANGGDRLREIVAGPRGALMPMRIRDAERIERAFWKMVDALGVARGRCLLHGDPHPGNCFTDKAGAGLYDWQTIARGPWSYDVGYAIVTALSIADRRNFERDLLEHYLDRLAKGGVKTVPRLEEAWDDYRRGIAYPLLIWPTNHTSHQSEDNIMALTERLGAAADDFNFFELWNV